MKTLKENVAHYARQWETKDRLMLSALCDEDEDERRRALAWICTDYKIARSLKLDYDVKLGMSRYAPLLALIDLSKVRCSSPSDAEDAENVVHWFRDQVAKLYGGVQALSLSSKVLWFVYRSPVVIYDRYAQLALGTPVGDYRSYLKEWRARFEEASPMISAASSEYSAERWFHERVFDIQLWHEGARIKNARTR